MDFLHPDPPLPVAAGTALNAPRRHLETSDANPGTKREVLKTETELKNV